MLRRIAFVALVCWLGISLGAAFAAETKDKDQEQMSPEMAEAMKLAQPGQHHEHLSKMVGSWKSKGKFWMIPGQPAEESDGAMTVKPALDGRFFVSNLTGSMMGDMPFQGMGMDGYDNLKQKHVGTWVDSMGTMIMHFEGNCSGGGKVLEMKSTYDDPMTKKPTYMRTVSTWKDDRTMIMEGFGPGPDGKDFKMMEITYTRQ